MVSENAFAFIIGEQRSSKLGQVRVDAKKKCACVWSFKRFEGVGLANQSLRARHPLHHLPAKQPMMTRRLQLTRCTLANDIQAQARPESQTSSPLCSRRCFASNCPRGAEGEGSAGTQRAARHGVRTCTFLRPPNSHCPPHTKLPTVLMAVLAAFPSIPTKNKIIFNKTLTAHDLF